MDALHITEANDVYQFVERLKAACRKHNAMVLLKEIDDALCLGSSGLEVLGAIRLAILKDRGEAERLLGEGGKGEIDQVLAFVDRAFGR